MATHQLAQGLAGLGRHGDSVLVHMQPHEVAGLQAIAKANGTSLTVNPDTGMPEAFSLGGFFNSLLPVFAGAATGGAGAPLWAGIAAGAATGAVTNRKNPLQGAVMGGLGGYSGFNIGSTLGAMGGAGATPANIAANPQGFMNANAINTANQAGITGGIEAGQGLVGINPAAQQALTTSGANISDPLVQDIARQAQQSAVPWQQNLSQATSNAGDLISGQPGAWNAYKEAGGSAMQLGMPLGGAVLGGLEPSDIYGKPIKPSEAGKYDPYASLNLSGDTGLRLYAQGGPVSFADGGDAMKGGGAEAMQGSGLLPLDVSDINAKYGYDPSSSSSWNSNAPLGMAFGRDQGSLGGLYHMINQASFQAPTAPKLGLFASNDQIEAARTAYEQQLAAAMAGRGGMGSTPNAAQIGRLRSANTGATIDTGISGLTNTAQTAETAPTAETALTRLNLNKNYANGGSIQMGGLRDLYGTQDDASTGPALSKEGYGMGRLQQMADGGIANYAKGGYLDGPGDGMSDDIPATIEGKQPARLADGEFVVPADVVSHLGNGSTKAGAKRLYGMLDKVRHARTGNRKQGKQINAERYLPA